jgi:uncharacterized Zn finger protein (UPF0148 family)
MTLAELQNRMSSAEFEAWLALAMLREDECPNCGVEPRDMMKFNYGEVKCPVCHSSYGKIRRWGSSAVRLEALEA